MSNKRYETWLVFIIISVVICVSMRYVTSIVDNVTQKSATTQTYTLMTIIEQMYMESLMNGTEELPFTAVFYNGEMYLKSSGGTNPYAGNVSFTGRLPRDGEIVMVSQNKIIVNNIKINNYVCNTVKEREVICEKA